MLKGPAAERTGLLIARILVPLWILTGAIFKLSAQTPSTLPRFTIFDPGAKMGLDMGIVLNVLIGLEFLAIAVMVFMPRLSRLMAGFMLSSFVLILTHELIRGAENCGCLGGKIKIHPGVMMGIDATLLLGVILFPTIKVQSINLLKGIAPAAVTTVLGFVLSFGVMAMSQKPGATPTQVIPQIAVTHDPAAPPVQIAFPNFWYVKGEINDWVGQYWNQVDLFQLIRQWPDDMAQGEKLVVFYRRDCDHCEEMFNRDFTGKIKTDIIAYHIPVEDPTWSLPPNHTAQLFELAGTDQIEWIITTPLVVKLMDGKITCAAEGEGFEPCLGVEPYDH